jgi:hypothetical protein
MLAIQQTQRKLFIPSNLFPAIGGGNLYEYITTNVDSGFMFCGGSEC